MLIAKSFPSDKQRKDPFMIIVISIIIGSILVVYPLSYAYAGWRPLFMLLITLFWVLCQPTWCGVWFAFSMGLFTDLLLDAPLGMNALSYVVLAFLTRYFIRERRVLTFSNLWVIITLSLVAHLVLTLMAQTMLGVRFSLTRHWQPLLASIFSWPILYYLLKRWRI
ncbi:MULTISPECIES: rod shape-determining protein MreD [Acinetobacter]|uniref:rod shape-determining protein MreD n=1 Tax=Acinetobacter TaxID=469 RepID=UPI0025763D29|nr:MULTISPECIES: rod shape-determining protein MreD [Acinetobacter]MDM1763006.1 rod shape-determining protein MreD [Acinetobacter sp. 226-1]MDM1766485.1 rod shape-determining protein MreD [Acinetobacter sp. 226-4]MDQ9020012.1 rod shape-determining protein MreD [Acinetobacter sichuanensis]